MEQWKERVRARCTKEYREGAVCHTAMTLLENAIRIRTDLLLEIAFVCTVHRGMVGIASIRLKEDMITPTDCYCGREMFFRVQEENWWVVYSCAEHHFELLVQKSAEALGISRVIEIKGKNRHISGHA